MTYIFNSNKKTESFSKISSLNGKKPLSKQNNNKLTIGLLVASNLISLFIGSSLSNTPSAPLSLQPREGYSQVLVSLELKIPFEKGVEVKLYSASQKKIFSQIYLVEQIQVSPSSFSHEAVPPSYIIYSPDSFLQKLSNLRDLQAFPPSAPIQAQSLNKQSAKVSYEVTY